MMRVGAAGVPLVLLGLLASACGSPCAVAEREDLYGLYGGYEEPSRVALWCPATATPPVVLRPRARNWYVPRGASIAVRPEAVGGEVASWRLESCRTDLETNDPAVFLCGPGFEDPWEVVETVEDGDLLRVPAPAIREPLAACSDESTWLPTNYSTRPQPPFACVVERNHKLVALGDEEEVLGEWIHSYPFVQGSAFSLLPSYHGVVPRLTVTPSGPQRHHVRFEVDIDDAMVVAAQNDPLSEDTGRVCSLYLRPLAGVPDTEWVAVPLTHRFGEDIAVGEFDWTGGWSRTTFVFDCSFNRSSALPGASDGVSFVFELEKQSDGTVQTTFVPPELPPP